jgi:hypothetical protein
VIKLVEDMDHGLNAVLEQASAVPIHTREWPHKSVIGFADERRTSAPPLRLQMTERLDMIGQQKMLLMLELQVWSAPSVCSRSAPADHSAAAVPLQERRAAEVQITQEKNLVELKLLVRVLPHCACRHARPLWARLCAAL